MIQDILKENQYGFDAAARVIFEVEGEPGSHCKCSMISLSTALGISPGLDKKQYFNENGTPNQDGAQVLTSTFIQALGCNIRYQHDKGYKNDAVNMREVIAELERLLITNLELKEEKF